MPLAVTHILVPIIFLELLRDNFRKISRFFSKRHVFLVGIAGLLPDIDVHLITFVELLGKKFPTTELGHRIIFHNIWVPLGFFIFYLIFYYIVPKYFKKSRKRFERFGKVFLVLFIGWTIHLILDAALTGYVMPFFPLNTYLLDYSLIGRLSETTGMAMETILVSMDALLLLFWLWHEEMLNYIKDYF